MSDDRWERIQALFASASELPPAQRAAYLNQATDDASLRAEVQSLLAAGEGTGRLDSIAAHLGSPADVAAATSDPWSRLHAALRDRYRIERELGRGGMAIVYLAEDVKHRRRVALKVLRPELAPHLGTRRFLREIETAARLTHPHILALHDSGEAGGLFYYVMPYVEGESLRDRLDREGQIPLAEAMAIAREVADALSYAHTLGVVHRDIKPDNILCTAGHALVSDFGIARALDVAGSDRITQTGVALGTPAYMSPEQAGAGRTIDARSDIYSLGCVVYEMLGGQPPFTGPTPQAVVARHTLDPVPSLRTLRPSVPPGVQDVIERALAKVPADRFTTAREFGEALERALAAPQTGRPQGPQPRRRGIVLGALLAVVVGGGAWWIVTVAGEPAIRRVAVLPLANLMNDPEQEYLVQGVHDALISELQQAGVTVIGRTSVMQYRDLETPIRTIARALAVDAVIEGSVVRAGDSVQIEARLVHGRTDESLWHNTYRADLRNVLRLYRDFTGAIAREIQGVLRTQPGVRPAERTVDPRAYEAYLRGRFQSSQWTEGDIVLARQYFQEAIELDPAYALPYVGLAQTYIWGPLPRETTAKARPLVERALELDSTLAEAHAVLAAIKFRNDWDWLGADTEFKRAIQLNPNNADAQHMYSHLLLALGRDHESQIASERALSLDLRSPAMTTHMGTHYIATRQYDRAIEQFRRALALDPNFSEAHFQLAWALLAQGLHQEAIAAFNRAMVLRGDPFDIALLGYAYARSGRTLEGQQRLRELQDRSKTSYVPSYYVALAHAGLGQVDQAFALLEKAHQDRDVFMSELRWNPLWDGLRSDPRFQSLLRRMNFPT